MEPAIRVTNLGKRYRVTGAEKAPYRTLRESLTGLATAPLRRLMGRSTRAGEVSDFWALKDVSFEVQPGEVVGIIGRNGAGKSTLLKILSRITKPTTGRVEINGRVGSLLEVGTGFHPELTGRENVYLNGSILGMSRKEIDRKFDEIVAFAEIDQFLDTPVKRYSSGMYVRLAFAVAAHLEPEILIVDEVLAVGDVGFQKKCLGRMRTVAGDGRTILFVSHNIAALQSLCTRGVYLEEGKIACDSSVKEAAGLYLNKSQYCHNSINWEKSVAPADNGLILIRAAILDYNGEVATRLTCQSPLRIMLEYKVTKTIRNLSIGFDLQNKEGILVCGSNSEGARETHEPGNYTAECRFPGWLFNEDCYKIKFILHVIDRVLLATDWCLAFDLYDDEGHGSGRIKIHGITRPQLQWSVSPISFGTSEYA